MFETVHLLKNIVIKLNVNHPFYEKVLQPLCGNLHETNAGNSTDRQLQQDIKNAILLLLFAYAKAESMYGDEHESVLEGLRTQWGVTLSAALSQYNLGD